MKSKKLISLLCAAALSASAFAGLAIPASAAADPVWSYNGDSIEGWTQLGTMTKETDENGDSYLQVTTQPTKVNGKILTLPAAAQLTDDYVIDFDVNLEAGDGMGRLGQYTQVAFTGDSPTVDTQDYGGAYATAAQEAGTNPDTEHSWNTGSETGLGYQGKIAASLMSRTELQGKWVVNYAGAAPAITDGDVMVGDNKWVRVRAAVSGGKANITIADGSKTLLTKEFAADATKLTSIYIASGRSDTQFFTSTKRSAIKLDNIAIYDGVANAPQFSTAGLRGYVAPTPEPAKVAAPVVKAPSSATVALDENFSKVDKMTVTQTDTKTTTAIGTGLDATMGGKEDGSSFVSVGDYVPGDKLMSVSGGRFTLAGRGPIISFKNTLASEYAANNTIVAAFAVNISKSSENGAGRLYFLKDTTQEGTDGNGAYRNIAAVLTTVQDEEIKRGETDVISTYVTPDEWHTVAFVLTGDKFRVYVDDAKEANVVGQYVATGGNASQLSELPIISTMSKAAKVNGEDQVSDYSFLRIDNIVTYSSTETSDLKKVLPTTEAAATPAPTEVPKHSVTIEQVQDNNQQVKVTSADTANDTFDGVLIHASYANGKLADVEAKDLKNISKTGVTATLTNTVAVGDKFYVWNDLKGMIPYGTATATAGVTKYTVTATADDGLDIEADKTSVEAGETVTLTVANTLTGVAFDGFETTGIAASAIQVGAEDGKYTFTMPAANVTIRAKAKALVAPAAITKAATTNGSFTVKVGNEEVQTAAKGASVVITPTASQGYKVGNVKVEPTDNVNLAVPVTNNNDGTYTFTMPEVAVTVTVTFVEDSAPAATPTTAPAATPTTAPAATPTTAPVATPTAAPTPTPVPTYTVTITQPTGGTISVKNGADDVTTGATIAAGTELTVSFENTSGYLGGTVSVKDADNEDVTVTAGKFTMPAKNVQITATGIEQIIPYADGTLTFDENNAVSVFTDLARSTPSLSATAQGVNTTPHQKISYNGGHPRAQYRPYVDYLLTGEAAKVSFDFTSTESNITNDKKNGYFSITGGAVNNSEIDGIAATTNIITSIGAGEDNLLTVYEGKADGAETETTTAIQGTNLSSNWYHVDAVVNSTAKTVALKIYSYKPSNNYTTETPLYNKTVNFRDKNVTGVSGIIYGVTHNASVGYIDNIYFNDPTYVEPNIVTVTAPDEADGTLTASKAKIQAEDSLEIRPVAADGKKVVAVKVNGDAITANGEGKYIYTAPNPAVDITVTAEFARADVTGVTITSENSSVQKGNTGTYSATVKAGETTLTGADAAVTWGVKGAESGAPTSMAGFEISQAGVLTVPNSDDAVGNIVVTASIKKDITNASTEVANTVVGEFPVTIVGEPVYGLSSSLTNETDHGTLSFTVNSNEAATQVKQSESVTVVPHAVAGYQLVAGSVKYKLASAEDTDANWTALASPYTISGSALSGDIVVKATFEVIEYNITNANNDITILVDGVAANKATVGQTVTIKTTDKINKKLDTSATLSVAPEQTLTGNEYYKQFTMPASNVTVTASATIWDGAGTYLALVDFENGEYTPFVLQNGNTKTDFGDPRVIESDGATANGNSGKFFGIPATNSNDRMVHSGAVAVGIDDIKVEADFRFDPGNQSKTSEIGLFGATTASNWFQTTDKELFQIVATASGNMTFGSMYINSSTNAVDNSKAFVNNTSSTSEAQWTGNKTTYNSTGWLHLNAIVHPLTNKVDITLTRISDSSVVVSGTYDYVNSNAFTGNLYFYVHHHKAYGGVSLDNVKMSVATGE